MLQSALEFQRVEIIKLLIERPGQESGAGRVVGGLKLMATPLLPPSACPKRL